MVDLSTTYLGLKLRNPLVASASPLSEKIETACRLEEAGIGAIVMYSLFEEQIIQQSLELDYYLSRGAYGSAEAVSYLPNGDRFRVGPEGYLKQVRRLKEAVKVPVIGSLNGVSTGGWIEYAQKIEEAGADALELNLYYLPTDPQLTSDELEYTYITLVRNIRARIKIPIAVKLAPFFTTLPNLARRLAEAGADGLVLFNRFYQPDFDLDELEVVPSLILSNSNHLRLPLRWIAILYGRVKVDFALTSGVHTAQDAIKAIMAGASAVMMASALLERGPAYVTTILDDMRSWMEEREYESVEQMRGSMSQQSVAEPAALERANYIKVLHSFNPYEMAHIDR